MSKKAAKTTKPAKSTKPAAKQAVVKPAVEAREQRNGVTRPSDGTMCARVWQALDKLRAKNADTTFDAVRELAGKEMADATIRTQRQRYNEFHGITRDAKKLARKPRAAAKQTAAPAVVTPEASAPAA